MKQYDIIDKWDYIMAENIPLCEKHTKVILDNTNCSVLELNKTTTKPCHFCDKKEK